MCEPLPAQPQWNTSSRLLKLGESIEFHFCCPDQRKSNDLALFCCYLEHSEPGAAFVAGGDLDWLNDLTLQRFGLTFRNGRASVTHTPRKPGSYLARWQICGEVLYRYFAVIENNWIVLRFSTGTDLNVEPTLHATGIPLGYRLPIDRFDPHDPLFRKLLGYVRIYGDSLVAVLPDTPDLSHAERVALYARDLTKVAELLPDVSGARSAWIEAQHEFDPGYTRALT